MLGRLEGHRRGLCLRYEQALNDSLREVIVALANEDLRRFLADSIIPAWLGTEWDYNGTSQTPGTGHIACGYLVTTCLRDAGFRLPRIRLAQQPAEVIIRRLVSPALCRRWSDVTLERFVADVKAMGEGVYIIGLDYHVGFLIVDSDSVVFWHSSYIDPMMVVGEPAIRSPILGASRYRVAGRIVPHPDLIRAWLSDQPVGAQ
jgi:hypothetical protein